MATVIDGKVLVVEARPAAVEMTDPREIAALPANVTSVGLDLLVEVTSLSTRSQSERLGGPIGAGLHARALLCCGRSRGPTGGTPMPRGCRSAGLQDPRPSVPQDPEPVQRAATKTTKTQPRRRPRVRLDVPQLGPGSVRDLPASEGERLARRLRDAGEDFLAERFGDALSTLRPLASRYAAPSRRCRSSTASRCTASVAGQRRHTGSSNTRRSLGLSTSCRCSRTVTGHWAGSTTCMTSGTG